jgi:hypothetical protein
VSLLAFSMQGSETLVFSACRIVKDSVYGRKLIFFACAPGSEDIDAQLPRKRKRGPRGRDSDNDEEDGEEIVLSQEEESSDHDDAVCSSGFWNVAGSNMP